MIIGKISRILNEVMNDKELTKLSVDSSSTKSTGKGADAIAVGAATPYKMNNTSKTDIFSKQYPALGKIIQRIKDDSLKGDVIVQGTALLQLEEMLKLMEINCDNDGEVILPFGQGIRLRQKNGAYYIGRK